MRIGLAGFIRHPGRRANGPPRFPKILRLCLSKPASPCPNKRIAHAGIDSRVARSIGRHRLHLDLARWRRQQPALRCQEWRRRTESGRTCRRSPAGRAAQSLAAACLAASGAGMAEPGAWHACNRCGSGGTPAGNAAARVVGAAHAGWRGLAGGVLENTISSMREAGAGEIMAWLGPAIGPERFEVGADVLQAFTAIDENHRSAFRPIAGQEGKYLADLYALARRKLAAAGVHKVTGGGCCSVSDAKRFYSYRRDGVTGRMASLIWLK